jgi:Protein of unknown function (DUF3089)
MAIKTVGCFAAVVAITLLLLGGCKIKITVPAGGKVITESGSYECQSKQVCTIDIYDIFFDEIFLAIPDSSYTFAGWKKKQRGFCGGSNKPCHLLTTRFAEYEVLMKILESDEVFYLEPVFTKQSTAPSDINPYATYTSELYEGTENWLCRPDIAGDTNICNRDLSSTIVFADGTTQFEEWPAGEEQEVDCFYVYPTISGDAPYNSDLVPDENQEIRTVYYQAARYRSSCQLYAPVYRQSTTAYTFSDKSDDTEVYGRAYADVLDAFKYYTANAQGRGFILVGHSQGSRHLIRLIQEEIESNPYLASRMVAAHLIGFKVALPNDGEVGATFQSTPPCTFDEETACFVNYRSFRETDPPVRGDSDATRTACTNPADLGGGRLILDSYFLSSRQDAFSDEASNDDITTPFIKLPGLVQGECLEQDGIGYLSISVDADPDDPRVDDVGKNFLPGWGLHLSDMELAHGDLVRLAKKQTDAWLED